MGEHITFDTLFEAKASIPSRLKTHVLADAFIAHNPDVPLDSRMHDRDDTIKNAIVAFVRLIGNTLEFVAGEMDISKEFAVQFAEAYHPPHRCNSICGRAGYLQAKALRVTIP